MGASGGTMMCTKAEVVRPLVRSMMSYLKTAVPGGGPVGCVGVRVRVCLGGGGGGKAHVLCVLMAWRSSWHNAAASAHR